MQSLTGSNLIFTKVSYRIATGNIAINIAEPLSKNRDSAERAYRYLTSQ